MIWSWNFIVARTLADSMPPVTLAFLRWTTAVIFLLPFSLPALWRDRRMVVKHLGYLSVTGFLGVTMFNTLVYIAGHTTKALNMSLVAISSPVFIVIFARIFLGDPFNVHRIAGLVTATIGVTLLITDGDLHRLTALSLSLGDLWMVVAAAIFAGYSILVRLKPAGLKPVVFLSSMFILGLVFLVPWLGWELSDPRHMVFSKEVIGAILYLGVGPSLLAFLCWNRAVEIVGPAQAAFVYYSLPIFSGAEAFVFLREPVDWIHFLSGFLIVAGIIVATRDAAAS